MWQCDPVRLTQAKLILVPLLVVAALMVPVLGLPLMALLLVGLVLKCPGGARQLRRVVLFMSVNWALIIGVYLLKFGVDGVLPAMEVASRVLLAILPGLWFYLSTQSHHVVLALDPWMSVRNAAVLSAALSLLPHLVNETRVLYQLARLRGARIAPKDFTRLHGYRELSETVLLPLIVQLMRYSQQQEIALRCRGYQEQQPVTRFPYKDLL
ncbi:energy-coupling factor transporter transmembrane component T [Ferrimonas pelagia]|uniref:Energy-coupling factor transporter transmembrane protein EcfT n=1 Tax=Ferrimonas pelagia TaxID=1177826 RepID=A0ABP9FG61_9GAMM